jgi:hypothetical protein
MDLYIRYNHIIFSSKIKSLDKDCKYSQDWATIATITTVATPRNI